MRTDFLGARPNRGAVMMQVLGNEPVDRFEAQVFRRVSTCAFDGTCHANIMVPTAEYGLDEQDVVLVTQAGVCTIDAKAYEPGSYRSGLNKALQWRKDGEQEFIELNGRLSKPLGVAANKGKKIVSTLQSLASSAAIGLKYLPSDLQILSVIVVPDHARFDADVSKLEGTHGIKFPCRLVRLSDLTSFLETGMGTAPAYKHPESVEKLMEAFRLMLNDWVPSQNGRPRRLGSIDLVERISTFDNEVPGETWRGIDNGEAVFVKLFFKYPWREGSASFFRRAFLQARALRQARLPRVVALHAVYEWPELLAMEYEWFENEGSLELAVQTLHGLSPEDAVSIFRNVAEALQLLHENPGREGVVFRALHPGNILLRKWTGAANWRNVDFLMVGFDRAVVMGHSSAGYEGASPYDPPEMRTQGGDALRRGPTVDVYALGMLLRFLISGRHPCADTEPQESGVPANWARVIGRATSGRAIERYQTIKDLVNDIS